MGRAASGIVFTGLVEAQGAVDRQPDFGGINILLAIVFPPADRTKGKRAGRLQRLQSAAWTAKTSLHGSPQEGWTGNGARGVTSPEKTGTKNGVPDWAAMPGAQIAVQL